jgi:predicted Zn-dependent protease
MTEPLVDQRQPLGREVSSRMVAISGIALALGLLACATNPGTARTRRAMSEEEEVEIGRQAAAEVERSMGFAGSAELTAYVEHIGQRLAKHSSRSQLDYEFHVVDMKEPNAFALPGGHIYVSRGLLALLNNEDELATVLGHEIAHVAARHSAKSKAKSRAWIPLQVLAGIGGAATSIVSPSLGSAVAGVGPWYWPATAASKRRRPIDSGKTTPPPRAGTPRPWQAAWTPSPVSRSSKVDAIHAR